MWFQRDYLSQNSATLPAATGCHLNLEMVGWNIGIRDAVAVHSAHREHVRAQPSSGERWRQPGILGNATKAAMIQDSPFSNRLESGRQREPRGVGR